MPSVAAAARAHRGLLNSASHNDDHDDLDKVERLPLVVDFNDRNNMRLTTRRSRTVGWAARNSGYIFTFCVFIAFWRAGLLAGHTHPEVTSYPDASQPDNKWLSQPSRLLSFSYSRSQSVIAEHPIPKLMQEAEEQYRKKLQSQSQSLRAATKEYRRRYKINPPKGFDAWWQFAKDNNVKMVDEYDSLMDDLAPFWELSGEELRRRAFQVGEFPDIDLVRIKDGKAYTVNVEDGANIYEDTPTSARAAGFREMMRKFVHTLPDMDFPINAKAEGRVLVPWEHRAHPNLTLQDSAEGLEAMLGGEFLPDWGNDGNVWDAWRRTCHPSTAARRLYSSLRDAFAISSPLPHSGDPGSDFIFARSTSAKFDFCNQPHSHNTQGHFFSDWRTIPVVYPVFSPARAKGFLDIKIPSHYYYGSTPRYTYGWDPVNLELHDVDIMEVPWEKKEDRVFWRGASTGGGNHPQGFSHQYQRHRLVRMTSDASNVTRTVTFADPPTTTHYVTAQVPVKQLNEEVMDVAFVKAVSPDAYPGGLSAMRRDHRFGDAVPLGLHWAYKYLLDIDGMGYSGRFMALLASDSVPVKATVYEEYYSDWIQPWVHFIPLSASYKEIYNIFTFFSGPTQSTLEAINSTQLNTPVEERGSVEGDRRLRRIARAGKQWKKSIGRKVDMEVYVYRLAIEWARLWQDDREAMSYVL